MAKNYQQDGNTLDFQNTGATLTAEAGEAAAPNPLAGTAWAEAAADADSVPVRLGY
ncbi:TPA: hypothetical protein OT017_000664 [Enterobacter hormaechei]|nr:hypothetical protein [Enterobacter hormaechei]HCT5221785.1 hypothetical protein [Enterobacter hormaechei]HCT5227238.1 hypothetical protein [Enterobacter hormaechei]